MSAREGDYPSAVVPNESLITKEAKMNKLRNFLSAIAALVLLAGCGTMPPSTAVSYHVGFNLLNSTNTVIADLSSMNSDGSDRQIVMSSIGRLLVSAQVNIQNPGGI